VVKVYCSSISPRIWLLHLKKVLISFTVFLVDKEAVKYTCISE